VSVFLSPIRNPPKKLIKFPSIKIPDDKKFDKIVRDLNGSSNNSVFLQRTEDSSASQYFQFYGYLSQQQNMMQDFVRTSTYQKAIHGNFSDFNVSFID
jgi:glutathione synthase/RimK-type ligase-like ATP-grasp enzyme